MDLILMGNTRKFGFLIALLGVVLCIFSASAAQEDASVDETQMDVLAHGPIHEAFAETIAFDPEPGIVVPKAPPAPIKEIPPNEKPEGDAEWIPGYWGWDGDRNDFIWISGTWRVVPPGRQWIPGYWAPAGGGYQWISGYWAPEYNNATTYLPEPPESVEVGPNVNAPSPDYTWIPGCWIWYNNAYAWRPGYWAMMRPDWVWVPAHYVWSPRGYVFVGGYWDFAVGFRGVLFAPVAFGVGVAWGSGFYFTPTFMINIGVFSNCLFVRPGYHHYYFGDYYATRYYRKGIFPWFSPHARRYGYDPIYAHQRWKHRNNPHWERNLQRTYQLRREDRAARPPRTFQQQLKFERQGKMLKTTGHSVKEPFLPLTKMRKDLPKFETVSRNEHLQIEQRGSQLRNLSNQRLKLESERIAGRSARPSQKMKVTRVTLPKSPIAATPVQQTFENNAAPTRNQYSLPSTRTPVPNRGPGNSKRIDSNRSSVPKSPGLQNVPGRSSRPTGQVSSRKMPPARYNTPQTDATVQPLKRKTYRNTTPSKGISVPTQPRGSQRPIAAPPTSRNRNAPQSNRGIEIPQRGPSGPSGYPGRPEAPRGGTPGWGGGHQPQFPGR